MNTDRYYVLDCVISPENNTLSRGQQHIHLEPKVMDCLVFFLQNSSEILSRDELIHSVWQDRMVNDEAVNRVIYRIRSAFQELGIEQELLITHRKRGYQWVLHVDHSHTPAEHDINDVLPADNDHALLKKLTFAIMVIVFFTLVIF